MGAAVSPESAPLTAAERVANPQPHPSFDAFVATISALRAPDGCPWDREQTHQSIAHNMIEEAYEAVDAIEAAAAAADADAAAAAEGSDDSADSAPSASRVAVSHLREELGDVLLQVVLQSQIAADAGEFTIDDVCADVNAKMIRRHPHVFGEASAADASAVLNLWDQVKLAEKEAADDAASAQGAARKGLLDGVPTSFPALMQAQKISRKAVAAGFEWDTLDDVWSQVAEEIAELKEAYAAAPKGSDGKVSPTGALPQGAPAACSAAGGSGPAAPDGAAPAASAATPEELAAAVEMEFGDVLFALVNVARRMGVDGENALRATCGKFRRRWTFMEQAAWNEGRSIEELTTAEQEALWQQAKAAE
ncbi:MAG TPA: nucleoside triphosphate pyrophosphohydrolase [Candidatus Aphodovivens avistercoris]|nr:nucleoside triphosphate pyrophosphohydrolase [Candidatus Aphodovivens avistercoris]